MSFDLVTTFPTLGNAPITEAVIDIRVARRADVTLQELAEFDIGLEADFPKKAERRSLQTRVEFNNGEARLVAPASASDGYVFTSADGRYIVQVSFDGFTLSRLRPYQKWSAFSDQARNLWKRYANLSRPQGVTRLGVRNINRIAMEPGVDMLSLVLTAPQIAMALPQTMIDLFMRVAIPDPSGSVAVIHQTLAPMQGGESAPPLIFDVDALRDVHMDPNDDEGIWAALEELRCLKNRIFFNSLTTRAIERYRNDDPS